MRKTGGHHGGQRAFLEFHKELPRRFVQFMKIIYFKQIRVEINIVSAEIASIYQKNEEKKKDPDRL